MARETDSRDSDTHDPTTPERRTRARPAAQGLPQSPWQQPHQPDAPAPLTPEQQETILTAALTLLGDKAWWLPKWMDRLLPDVDVEGAKLEGKLAH